MGETLFVAHRMPFPPDRGDKIRSHHLLKALCRLGPVHVATLGETDVDFRSEPLLAELARSHCLARRAGNLPLAGLRAFTAGWPVSLAAFDSPQLRTWISQALDAHPIDTIFVFSGQMGQFVPAEFAGRVVVDLCDVDSAKFESYADNHAWPRRWIYAREARLLAAEEARLAHRADATLLISQDEAELFRRRVGRTRANVITLANGIDTDLFDPAAVAPDPRLVADTGPHIVMTGQMDYPPNVAAVLRTARQLMPAIREVYPAAKFHVVGRNAGAEVRALGGLNGTRVWGEVPDVRPFLAAADLVVAPLTIARGVQNKVLEAMAMARPILLSAEAATGIGAADGEHYAVGSDDQDMAKRALELLSDRPVALAMGASAKRFVIEHKSWDAALAPLADIIGGPTVEARDAA